MLAPAIENLIKIFSKFPTIGPKTAARFVFFLLQSPAQTSENLIKAIQELKEKIKICPQCLKSFENKTELCEICSNPARDKSLICVVEKEIDLEAIEKTATYKGLYFILGGVLPILKKETVEQNFEVTIRILCDRIKYAQEEKNEKEGIKEIILAINPTLEGQNTVLWLKRKLEPLGVKITQLAKGMPQGGELEYADEETISSAFEGRK